MKRNTWFDIVIVGAWVLLFGMGAFKVNSDNWLFELTALISGGSLGLLVSRGLRYLETKLKILG